MSTDCSSDDVKAAFTYALPNPNGEISYITSQSTEPPTFQINFIRDPHESIDVQNLRDRMGDFSLDANGFKYLTHSTSVNLTNGAFDVQRYYEEVQRLIQKDTGAKQVVAFSYKFRQSYETSPQETAANTDRRPVHLVHNDRTLKSAAIDAEHYVPTDQRKLLQGRIRVICVWRPVGDEVHHEPLAVVDWKSSSVDDLLPVLVRDDNSSQGQDQFLSRFSGDHKWYYLEHQTPSEVTLIKCQDNRVGQPDTVADFCLHSAFRNTGCQQGVPRRRSIEVNVLVFG